MSDRVSRFEAVLGEVLNAGHRVTFVAGGDSMYPALRDGDTLQVAPCTLSELRRGDVAVVRAERGVTAHRVMQIALDRGDGVFTTRGDNALRSDGSLHSSSLLGRVDAVERDGAVVDDWQSVSPSLSLLRASVRRIRARMRR